jgi:hypothetical protein
VKFELHSGLSFMYNGFAMSSIFVKQKKKGRPATGVDPLVAFRSPPILTAALDAFASSQKPPLSRSEAVRKITQEWLVERGYLPADHDP